MGRRAERSGAVYGKEPPRPGWREILLLVERLAPAPRLLPRDAAAREQVLALAATICDRGGLNWTRRLQLVHAGLQGRPGFNARASNYLAKKYGHSEEEGGAAGARVAELLGALAVRLKAQHARGSDYFVGAGLTAADVYVATAMALFKPLPQAVCEMVPGDPRRLRGARRADRRRARRRAAGAPRHDVRAAPGDAAPAVGAKRPMAVQRKEAP
jgi:glutathione S-transferase